MPYQAISGQGIYWPDPSWLPSSTTPSHVSVGTIDATGEKVAFNGRVFFPSRTGTKDIQRVGFRFGSTVTKTGGSGLTVSLQDQLLTAAPVQPDETQDQTVAIANGNASFAASTWIRTDALSANRTVSFAEKLSIVVEYDGSGRLGADTVSFSNLNTPYAPHSPATTLKTASWALAVGAPNVILEFSDGTFGTLYSGGFPASTFSTASFGVNTGTADEYAMPFTVPVNCKVDGLWGWAAFAAGADFEFIIYEGTTPVGTITIDGDEGGGSAMRPFVFPFDSEVTLTAGTQYYLAYRPTTTTAIQVGWAEVADANHLSVWPGGTGITYTTRLNQGSWAAVTSTRRLFAAVRISAIESGALLPMIRRGGLSARL